MTSCRSRKTGNCSDWPKKKYLPQKAPETSRGIFLFPDRLPYASPMGRSQYRRNPEAPAWHRSGELLFWTVHAAVVGLEWRTTAGH